MEHVDVKRLGIRAFVKSADLGAEAEPRPEPVYARLGLVDTESEQSFDRLTRLVVLCVKVPVALLSFVEEDKDRQFFKSQIGLAEPWAGERCTPLSHSFCQYVKRDNRPLIVEDALNDARVCTNLAIPDLGVQAYLGVPVHGPAGKALGALCAIDGQPRHWAQDEVNIMVELAACVTAQIKLRQRLMVVMSG